MKPTPFKLGWRREFNDKRDFKFVSQVSSAQAPSKFVLPWIQSAVNQGPVGSCVGNAVCTAVHAALMKQHSPTFQPSRLFNYYNARSRQGWEDIDSGAYIRDAIKSVAQEGVPNELDWPYDTRQLTTRPPDGVYEKALQHRGWLYRRVADYNPVTGSDPVSDIKACLLTEKLPVIFGFVLYSSFDWTNGIIEMPQAGDSVLGGHAAVVTGFNDETRRFKWQSSWGGDWAAFGRGEMTYDYFMDGWLTSDMWVLSAVTAPVLA